MILPSTLLLTHAHTAHRHVCQFFTPSVSNEQPVRAQNNVYTHNTRGSTCSMFLALVMGPRLKTRNKTGYPSYLVMIDLLSFSKTQFPTVTFYFLPYDTRIAHAKCSVIMRIVHSFASSHGDIIFKYKNID